MITSRDFAQTESLLEFWGIEHRKIGKHGGKRKLNKIINLFSRANELRRYIKDKSVDLALSHGSRTQLVAAKILKIRSIVMMDYEYTETRIFNYLADYLLIPEYIPESRLRSVNIDIKKVLRYPGFKEQLYLDDFFPRAGFRKELNIGEDEILATIRPPAMEGNYHDSMSESILLKVIGKLTAIENVHPLIIHRTEADKSFLKSNFGEQIHFLEKAVNGLQLIWNSDIFISGGGSMNREAALLGVPAYSIFTGRKPYLDEKLCREKKLTFIDSLEKVDKIKISKRDISGKFDSNNTELINEVVDTVLSIDR